MGRGGGSRKSCLIIRVTSSISCPSEPYGSLPLALEKQEKRRPQINYILEFGGKIKN